MKRSPPIIAFTAFLPLAGFAVLIAAAAKKPLPEISVERFKQYLVRPEKKQQAEKPSLLEFSDNLPPTVMVRPINYKMVYIQPGTFMMGSALSAEEVEKEYGGKADWYQNEHPRHQVTLTKGFYLGTTEVANRQFVIFLNAVKGRRPRGEPWFKTEKEDSHSHIIDTGRIFKVEKGYEDHPVIEVSWYGAKAMADWLSDVSGQRFDLPTEAQWEYAATNRGKDNKYPWGNTQPDGTRMNYCDKNCVNNWSDKRIDDGYQTTAPVGAFPAGTSPLGIYDMAGNVWEWVRDGSNKYPIGPITDPLMEISNMDAHRIIRGGSWMGTAGNCRSTRRYFFAPDLCYYFVGFRLAMTP